MIETETPEPLPVVVSEQKCKIHGFAFVSMPRDEGGESYGYVAKCVFRTCPEGV